MQNLTITGNLGKDAELRNAGNSEVASFSVGVKNGFGQDANTVWYRCSLWGKPATVFIDSLKKGAKVTINGDLLHKEYDGKPQFDSRVGALDVHEKRGEQGGNQSSGGGSNSPRNQQAETITPLDDFDDDCPFVTNDFNQEWKVS